MSSAQPEPHLETDRCAFCGGARPASAPRGLCPRCLLQEGLEDSFADATGSPSNRTAGSIAREPGDGSVLARIAGSAGGVSRIRLRDPAIEVAAGPILKPSAELPSPGERPGRYQLFGEIARGGMGAVLRGRDVDLGRELAVKVLLRSHKDHPELVRRFVEEA
jgi:serine/threonine-protein kinase